MNKENNRIKELRKSLKLSQEGLGNAIGLTKSSVSNIENGIRNVTDQHIKLLCSELNVSEAWLRTGQGEMFVQSETFSLDEEAKKSNLTELEIAIMRGYMELDRSTREDIVSKLESIILRNSESAATLEPAQTPEQIAEQEAEAYRQEILAELKTQKSSASDGLKGKSS